MMDDTGLYVLGEYIYTNVQQIADESGFTVEELITAAADCIGLEVVKKEGAA